MIMIENVPLIYLVLPKENYPKRLKLCHDISRCYCCSCQSTNSVCLRVNESVLEPLAKTIDEIVTQISSTIRKTVCLHRNERDYFRIFSERVDEQNRFSNNSIDSFVGDPKINPFA